MIAAQNQEGFREEVGVVILGAMVFEHLHQVTRLSVGLSLRKLLVRGLEFVLDHFLIRKNQVVGQRALILNGLEERAQFLALLNLVCEFYAVIQSLEEVEFELVPVLKILVKFDQLGVDFLELWLLKGVVNVVDDETIRQGPDAVDEEEIVLFDGLDVTSSQKLFELRQIVVYQRDILGLINRVWRGQHQAQVRQRGETEDVISVV